MRKWNKLLAMLLAMVMALGLTATAFAEGETEDTTNPPAASDTEDDKKTEDEKTNDDAVQDSVDEIFNEEDEKDDDAEPADDADKKDDDAEPAVEIDYTGVEEWAKEHVTAIVEKKLMDVDENGSFNPNANMTRVDLVVALYRHAGAPSVDGKENQFEDIAELTEEQQNAIIWASSEKIVNGEEPTAFNPNGNVERQQIAKILFVYAKGENVEEDKLAAFPDKDDVAAYAVDCLNWLLAKEIMNGDGDKLNPTGTATRQQVATMLNRYINNVLTADDPAAPAEGEDDAAEPTEPAEDKDDAAEPAESEDKDDAAEPANEPAEGENDTDAPKADEDAETEDGKE